MTRYQTLCMVSKQILIIIISTIVILASIGFATFFALRANNEFRRAKQSALDNGQKLYVVIEQYEVEDFRFKQGSSVIVLYEAEFTSELDHVHKYENDQGFNIVEIKNGIVKVIDENCRDKRCTRGYLTNGISWFEAPSIICYPHGIKIKWEARAK